VGREKLALLQQGKSDKEAGIAFAKPIELARNQGGALVSPDALAKIFQTDPTKFPAYVTGTTPRGGFAIYRVTKVIEPTSLDEARLKLAGERMGDQLGREFATAYLASLKSRADVKINQAAAREEAAAVAPRRARPRAVLADQALLLGQPARALGALEIDALALLVGVIERLVGLVGAHGRARLRADVGALLRIGARLLAFCASSTRSFCSLRSSTSLFAISRAAFGLSGGGAPPTTSYFWPATGGWSE
jgi:hypothetical protein